MNTPTSLGVLGRLRLLAPGCAAVIAGLFIVALSGAETRWVAFSAAGLVLGIAALIMGVRRTVLAYFVLGLSVDAHYYLTTPRPPMYTGDTSPGAITIPLVLIPGFVLLMLRVLFSRHEERPLRFVGEFSKPMLGVMATAAIATLLSPMWFIGSCVLWQLAALYLLFLVTCNEVRSEDDAALVLKLLMVMLAGQCALFLVQLVTGVKFSAVGHVVEAGEDLWHSATGTAATTTAGFATFMQPLVAVAYAKFRTAAVSRERMFYGSLAALSAAVIVLTLNRSSLAGLPLGLLTVEVLLGRRALVQHGRNFLRRLLLVGTVLAAIVIAGLVLVQSKRTTTFSDDLDQRFDLMRPAVSMIAAHPVFGVGPGVHAFELVQYAADHEGWLYVTHNEYLIAWSERGTVGLLAWLLLIRAMFRIYLRRRTSAPMAAVGIGAAGGFVAYSWELCWSANMSFPVYGVVCVLAGLCALPERRAARVATAHAIPVVGSGAGAPVRRLRAS